MVITKSKPTPAKPPAPVKSAKGQAIATQKESAVPAFMQQDVGRGTENIGRDDMEVPRLKLIQALSKELQEYNDLRAGQFFHTASEAMVDGPLIIVPIFFDRRFILWNPRDSGGGILARADDGVNWQPRAEFTVKLDKKDGGKTVKWSTEDGTVRASGLADWGSMNPDDPNSSPAATLMLNFVVGFPERPDLLPATLTFQRSAIRIGRKFATRLKTNSGRAPIFGQRFTLESFIDKNRAGQEFHNFLLKGAGFLEDAEQYELYKSMNQGFTEAGLQIKDIEGLQDDASGDNEPDTEEDVEARDKAKGRPKY